MWVFYLISLPLTLGMVIWTLKYFSGPEVPRYVFFTVGYTWFCSISIIILVPADIWTTIVGSDNGGISFFWSWSYWSTFLLTWLVVPLIQGFEDAGDFTLVERLKTSIHANLVFYAILGIVGLLGLILLITMRKSWDGNALGFAMACSNTFGLVTGAFLLGFGMSEIPKSMWKNADWTTRQKVLSHKIAKMAVKLDDAHQELSNAIVVAQATSKQMSKRDPLRRYMDVIDNMLVQMFREDPSFKPQGGQLGENDMDYDTDDKSMAKLRRNLRIAREEYYRYKSEYLTYVTEALELEDTIKNYEQRNATGWKFVSTLRSERAGTLGSFFDTTELIWRCVLRKQLKKVSAVILCCMSVAILLAEATLLPRGVDLSLFSILIKSVGDQEVLVQVFAFLPLMYMCVCTYYSLFKAGMYMFYSLTPRQTSSVSLLMICSMIARYAPPISYNFLNLISLGENKKTIFEKRMGTVDKAVPFFGQGFNKIYPLIMVVYTLLVASNFFDRIIRFFGNWKIFRFQSETDDMDGFDPSGLLILQKERSWLEQGRKLGEHVLPLARNFNNMTVDLESDGNTIHTNDFESKAFMESSKDRGSSSKPLKDEARRYSGSKEAISSKYAALREQGKLPSHVKPMEEDIGSTKVSLLDSASSQSGRAVAAPSGLAGRWASMKSGFQNFKTNIEAKRSIPLRQVGEFVPLRQTQDTNVSRASSSESLDEIFQKLKRPATESENYGDDDDHERRPRR
ncbi:LMBR1 domain-containing protein 2 homolog A-like [Solanum tuberosum]|nr:PREDICTED: LMBR1 domain-containing protein 2 homolog A-like [Solanum tuberosum]